MQELPSHRPEKKLCGLTKWGLRVVRVGSPLSSWLIEGIIFMAFCQSAVPYLRGKFCYNLTMCQQIPSSLNRMKATRFRHDQKNNGLEVTAVGNLGINQTHDIVLPTCLPTPPPIT